MYISLLSLLFFQESPFENILIRDSGCNFLPPNKTKEKIKGRGGLVLNELKGMS